MISPTYLKEAAHWHPRIAPVARLPGRSGSSLRREANVDIPVAGTPFCVHFVSV